MPIFSGTEWRKNVEGHGRRLRRKAQRRLTFLPTAVTLHRKTLVLPDLTRYQQDNVIALFLYYNISILHYYFMRIFRYYNIQIIRYTPIGQLQLIIMRHKFQPLCSMHNYLILGFIVIHKDKKPLNRSDIIRIFQVRKKKSYPLHIYVKYLMYLCVILENRYYE